MVWWHPWRNILNNRHKVKHRQGIVGQSEGPCGTSASAVQSQFGPACSIIFWWQPNVFLDGDCTLWYQYSKQSETKALVQAFCWFILHPAVCLLFSARYRMTRAGHAYIIPDDWNHMEVSWNGATPRSFFKIGFVIANYPFGVPNFFKPCMYTQHTVLKVRSLAGLDGFTASSTQQFHFQGSNKAEWTPSRRFQGDYMRKILWNTLNISPQKFKIDIYVCIYHRWIWQFVHSYRAYTHTHTVVRMLRPSKHLWKQVTIIMHVFKPHFSTHLEGRGRFILCFF